MFKLSIEKLESRWADIKFTLNEEVFLCYFEACPNDALLDLIESGIRITGGIESAVSFPNGSHKETLFVKNGDSNLCCIEINDFKINLKKRDFVKAILRMFDKYIYEHSKEDYNKEWCGFPKVEFEKLRVRFRAV